MLVYMIGTGIYILSDFLCFKIGQKYYAKKCNYECSKCKNWACNKYQCMKYSKGKVKDE